MDELELDIPKGKDDKARAKSEERMNYILAVLLVVSSVAIYVTR